MWWLARDRGRVFEILGGRWGPILIGVVALRYLVPFLWDAYDESRDRAERDAAFLERCAAEHDHPAHCPELVEANGDDCYRFFRSDGIRRGMEAPRYAACLHLSFPVWNAERVAREKRRAREKHPYERGR